MVSAPAIILVRPQLPENIGAAARAMRNCGLADLRLVRPRMRWPHAKARAVAAGADRVLDQAKLFETVEAAVSDLGYVLATTARPRDQVKPVLTPRAAAAELRARAAARTRAGILFGPERTGLENEETDLADAFVSVPLDPGFSSLNLAQAVLVLAYEWFQAGDVTPARRMPPAARVVPASKAELAAFFARLEAELKACGFLRNPEMQPVMARNIRSMFARAELTEQEIRTLHGMLTGLTQRPHAPRERSAGTATKGRPEASKSPARRRR